MSALISICVCTCGRASLATTLASLARQVIQVDCKAELVIVDNGPTRSASSIVERLAEQLPFPVRYDVEEVKGLASARNRALALSCGEWLAFIDDDEVADPYWIAELISCAIRFGADAVVGAVRVQFEIEPARWYITSRFFEFPLPPTGAKLDMGQALSGNVLLRASFLKRHELVFDVAFNRTGGEDTDFFRRFCDKGGLIVSCREAVTRELVGTARLTTEYLKRRSLVTGEIYARVMRRYSRPWRFRISMLRATVNVIASGCLSTMLFFFGREYYYRYYLALIRNVGKLRCFLGYPPIEMYRDRSG